MALDRFERFLVQPVLGIVIVLVQTKTSPMSTCGTYSKECAWCRHPRRGVSMATLIIYKLVSMKFTTQNDLY